MLDAQSPLPLLGDTWAERFMGDEGRAVFERFLEFTIPNASNVVRHHIIDQILRSRLASEPRRRIVLLGAGFDARAFRLTGGEWFELDEAPIIERKNAIAPAAQAPNPLTRIAVDFASESLERVLAPLATTAPTTVVMEGVLYYLEPGAVATTLRALQRVFPQHELVCDLQSDAFVRKWGGGVIRRIAEFGAHWRFHPANPSAHIEQLGYRLTSATSVALRTAELRRIKPPAWAIRWLVPSLRDGYRVCVFERVR
jgi:methyltransferase (TIGR00027 family)